MKPHKFFFFLLILFAIAAGYYFYSTDRTSDTVLIGIVDANQVIVSSKIMGRVEKLYVDEGSKVKAGDLIAETNHAHALMFLGRVDEARALYLAHRNDIVSSTSNKTWSQAVAEDFAEFRKAGLVNPLMDEIEAALGAKGP